MAASITLRLTAVASNGQTQDEADAQFNEAFAAYSEEAIAEALATDIWTNMSFYPQLRVEKSEVTEA